MDRIQNYFINKDGTKYYTGTCVIVKHCGKKCDATFLCVIKPVKETDTKGPRYVFQLKGPEYYYQLTLTIEDLSERLVAIYTDVVDPYVRCPRTYHPKDSQIEGLPLAWAWYIFLMAISTIFKDNIGLWIFFSIVFFSYRSKKVKSIVGIEWYDDGSANREYNERICGKGIYKSYYDWQAARKEESRKRLEKWLKRY